MTTRMEIKMPLGEQVQRRYELLRDLQTYMQDRMVHIAAPSSRTGMALMPVFAAKAAAMLEGLDKELNALEQYLHGGR